MKKCFLFFLIFIVFICFTYIKADNYSGNKTVVAYVEPNSGNPFYAYGIAGPRIDILIGKNSEAAGAVFDDFKNTDFGGTFGFGFEIPIGEIYRAGCEFRYGPSIQNIFSNRILEVKNKSLEFLLVFGFK